MPMTIPQYAKDRHLSDKGVYKAPGNQGADIHGQVEREGCQNAF